jgi:hypothetical protein
MSPSSFRSRLRSIDSIANRLCRRVPHRTGGQLRGIRAPPRWRCDVAWSRWGIRTTVGVPGPRCARRALPVPEKSASNVSGNPCPFDHEAGTRTPFGLTRAVIARGRPSRSRQPPCCLLLGLGAAGQHDKRLEDGHQSCVERRHGRLQGLVGPELEFADRQRSEPNAMAANRQRSRTMMTSPTAASPHSTTLTARRRDSATYAGIWANSSTRYSRPATRARRQATAARGGRSTLSVMGRLSAPRMA